MRLAAAAVAATLTLVGLAACGDDEVCAAEDGADCFPDPSASAEPNAVDEDYVLQNALPVGEVLQLAELAGESSDDPDVVELADEVVDAADALLADFRQWEEEWDLEPLVYDSAASHGGAASHDRAASATGLTTLPRYGGDEDYAVLEDLEGVEFDAYWVNVVLERVRTQLRESPRLVTSGSHPGLRAQVEQWIDANEAWRDRLEELEAEIR